ncbi:MAG: hypothetical protein ACFFGZ_13690 [Candidatus Thorarchaeota archaeon]
MPEKKITAVAVRLKPEDKATSIFLKERRLVADRPGHLSDNKLIHKFIEAYPRITELEQQISDLQTQLQAERDRCEKFEEESREMDRKLRKALEDRVKDLETQREMDARIKKLEFQIAQKEV